MCTCLCERYWISCRHCHFEASSLLSCSLPMAQNIWAAALIEPKSHPVQEGVQLKEQERGNENKVIQRSLLCFFMSLLSPWPLPPPHPNVLPSSSHVLVSSSSSLCLQVSHVPLSFSTRCRYCTVLMLSSDVCFLVVLFPVSAPPNFLLLRTLPPLLLLPLRRSQWHQYHNRVHRRCYSPGSYSPRGNRMGI